MDPERPESPEPCPDDDFLAELDSEDVDVRDPPEDVTKKKIIQDGSEKWQEVEDEPQSPLLVSKSPTQDADENGESSSQHVSVDDAMVLDALDVLEKRHVRGMPVEKILEYLLLRFPVNPEKDQLLTELNQKLGELVDGGLVHLGENGNYLLCTFHEEAQQAEGRFGEPAPKVPPRPKPSGRKRTRVRSETPSRRRRSGSSSTSSTSSGSAKKRSRSPRPREPSVGGFPRDSPRVHRPHYPTYTREHPRRSQRLVRKRERR